MKKEKIIKILAKQVHYASGLHGGGKIEIKHFLYFIRIPGISSTSRTLVRTLCESRLLEYKE